MNAQSIKVAPMLAVAAAVFSCIGLVAACGPVEGASDATTKSSAAEAGDSDKQVVPYEVAQVEDISVGGRNRLRVYVVAPSADTESRRGDTAMQAAIELQEANSADMVVAFLEASEALVGQGFALAIARYAPDGGGNSGSDSFRDGDWEVEASNAAVSDKVIKVAEKWFEAEPNFQKPDGFGGTMADEEAIARHVANELSVPEVEVTMLPLLNVITTRHPYAWEK